MAAAPVARQCALSAAQSEEVFEKLLPQERLVLSEWCAEQVRQGNIRALLENRGRPTRWLVRTLDTGRWRPFVWRGVHVRFVPEAPNQESMFQVRHIT